MDVSLIVPSHNEERRLGATLAYYGRKLHQRFGEQFEILVIANNCKDNTVRIANEMASEIPQIRVVDIAQPIGKGGAVAEGVRQARGDRLVFADADASTTAESIIDLLEQLEKNDVVIGSRRLSGSAITRRSPVLRRALSWVFAALVRSLFSMPYRDTQCGAKAFRRAAAQLAIDAVTERGWAFDVDLLLAARALGLTVGEHPVSWAYCPGSRLRLLPALRDTCLAMTRLRRKELEREHRLQGFERLRILALNWRCMAHPQAGGAELNLFQQAHRWARDGHQITVFCADPGRAHAPRRDEIVDGIRIVRRGQRFTVYLHAAIFLLRNGRKFDVVLDVANGIPFFSPLFTRTRGVLLMHHVHGRQWFTEFLRPIATFGWFLERKVVPLVYRDRPVIAVSPTTRDALLAINFSESQVRIVYNGVSVVDAADRRAVPRGKHIVYVGRIKGYKRLERLLGIVVRLRYDFPDVILDIVGDGDARPRLEALTRELGVGECVKIHGYVDELTKARILRGALVFATPSMHEGWGLSALEASACGCPAVAYNVPGLRVAIRHGETGLLADDDESFYQALAFFLRDEGARTRYAGAAREWAGRFDWEAAAQATLAVMRLALSPAAATAISAPPERKDVVHSIEYRAAVDFLRRYDARVSVARLFPPSEGEKVPTIAGTAD